MKKMMKPASYLSILTTMFLMILSLDGGAAVLTYPGLAPCATTLQACINGAASGDEIQIATNNRINENLTLSKDITLTNASGFSPKIGSADELVIKTITVEDPGSGITAHVTVSHINFENARVQVSFSGDSGHSFSMQDCELTNKIDNNNDVGVELSLRVTSTVLLKRNIIRSSGSAISIYGSIDDGEVVQVTIVNNELTGTTPIESYQGIQLRNNFKGIFNVDIQSNLIHDVGSCFCGGPGGITIAQNGQGVWNVNLVNNTIANIVGGGANLYVYPPSSTGVLNLNFYNNTLTHGEDYGVFFPPLSSALVLNNDYNNTFNNTLNDEWGGYAPGANDLAADPLFVNLAMSDFTLQSESSLINAGTATIPGVTLTEFDLSGNDRVVGVIDVGAFEAADDTDDTDGSTTDTLTDTFENGGGCQLGTNTTGPYSLFLALGTLAVIRSLRRR